MSKPRWNTSSINKIKLMHENKTMRKNSWQQMVNTLTNKEYDHYVSINDREKAFNYILSKIKGRIKGDTGCYSREGRPGYITDDTEKEIIKRYNRKKTNIKEKYTIKNYLRSKVVTKQWTVYSLSHYNSKCYITGDIDNLEIHHPISFYTLCSHIGLTPENNKEKKYYTQSEIKTYTVELQRIHDSTIGIPLREDIHKLYHKHNGYDDISLNSLNNFKECYLRGDYAE